MGNKQSKIKQPHDVLGISSTATLEEIRARYILLLSSCPRDRQAITTAYTAITQGPPIFEDYTEEIISNDLSKYADDVYSRISKFTGTYIPVFSKDPEGVYRVCSGFRADPNKFENPQKYASFCYKVVQFTRLVRSLASGPELSAENTAEVCLLKKETLDKEFNCDICMRGFRSGNQILNHYRSKKHFAKVQELYENPQDIIENQIRDIPVDNNKKQADEIKVIEEMEIDVVQEQPVNEVKTKSNHVEPKIFRTCSYCDKVFNTRGYLLIHLRNEHKDEK